jgi:hypothetical protein
MDSRAFKWKVAKGLEAQFSSGISKRAVTKTI